MRRMALLLLILPLLGCPPVRENVADAEGGGSYVDAFLNYRYMPGYQLYIAYLIIPREEEDGTFDCDDGSGYGWYDDDQDFFELYFYRGEEVDWTGDYPSYYDPECEISGSYDYSIAHCWANADGVDPEGNWPDTNNLGFSLSSFDDSRVDGEVQYSEELSERFRATNCGELPSYYYEERGAEEETDDQAGAGFERHEGGWLLRFK